jgi:protocatechuate 3,4-dioxygenase beta subunit
MARAGWGPVLIGALFGATTLVAQVQSTGRAVIAGRVFDDLGDPVIAARVTVERKTTAGGVSIVASGDTDDRGEYRVPGLPAGSFVVAVRTIGGIQTQTISTPAGNQVAWSPAGHQTYFPGVSSAAEASTVTLEPRDERADINLVVPAAQATTQPFSIAGGGGATTIITSPFVTSVPRLGTGVIRGRVVATDGRPLARAQVGLVFTAVRLAQDLTRADGGGAFEFRGLSPGTYRIVASKPGYEPIVADAPPLGRRILYSGRSVTLVAGEATDPIDIPLAPLATLSGVVLDDNGDPLQGASVQLLTIHYEAGRRQLVSAEVAARVTDDVGRYRLFGIAPGQYVVSAAIGGVSSADVSGFVRSYFPATSNPVSAQSVAVRRSEAVAGIDISMVRGRTARVTGRILDAAGQPTTGGTVMLRPRQRASIVGVSVGARLLPDGRFEFPNVPPGDYVIQANRGRNNPSMEGAFGALPIVVNGTDVTDLVLAMSTGSTVSGSIRFETINPDKRPVPGTVEISSFPVDFDLAPWNGFATADVRADGQFQMTGLHGPRRLRVERVPAGWALKEILISGNDATDRAIAFGPQNSSLAGVEVVLTDRVSGVGGTVTDSNGKPVDGAFVVAFAADRDRWYPASRFFSTALMGPDGVFAITGLPAGSYYLAVVMRLPTDNAWQEPVFLDDLRRDATVITIAEGQRSSVTLHVPAR